MTTVLVVDDDRDIQLLLRLELEAEGYDVLTADNGRLALTEIAASSPDVVLLDVMMPELDGWGVLERLDDPKPAVIVVSGLATDRDTHHEHAIRMGALGFVAKPFDPEVLLRLVDTAASLDAAGRQAFRADLLGEPPG